MSAGHRVETDPFTSRPSLTSLTGSRLIHHQLTISSPYMSDLRRKAPHSKPSCPSEKEHHTTVPPKKAPGTLPPSGSTHPGTRADKYPPPNPQRQVARSSHHAIAPIPSRQPIVKNDGVSPHRSSPSSSTNTLSPPLASNPATHRDNSRIGRRSSDADASPGLRDDTTAER